MKNQKHTLRMDDGVLVLKNTYAVSPDGNHLKVSWEYPGRTGKSAMYNRVQLPLEGDAFWGAWQPSTSRPWDDQHAGTQSTLLWDSVRVITRLVGKMDLCKFSIYRSNPIQGCSKISSEKQRIVYGKKLYQ